jgi:hypothetical protein
MMNEVLLRQVLPGSEELVVRLPKAQWTRIKGTVLDPEGKPLPNVEVTTSMTGSGGDMNTVDPASGAFDVGPYPPGEFTLSLEAGGFAPIRVQKKLAPDEVWDLGTVRFQRGGSLVVNLVAPGAEPLAEPWVSVYDRHGLWCGNVEVAGGQGRIGPFAPGDYVLQIRGKNFAALQQPFAIRVDVETRIDVPLQAGVAVELRFPLPAGAPADGTPVEVRTRDGTVVLRVSAWPREGDPELRTVLRPGTYEVQATGPRFAGAGTFEVVAPGPVQARIPLALR